MIQIRRYPKDDEEVLMKMIGFLMSDEDRCYMKQGYRREVRYLC